MMLLDFRWIVAAFWVALGVLCDRATRVASGKPGKRSILLLPMLMAVGVGLTLINTRAVMEALFGREKRLRAHAEICHRRHAAEAHGGEENTSAGAVGCRISSWPAGRISSTCAGSRFPLSNYPTLPFLALFVGGYYWAGFGTLYQEYQDRLRYNRQTRLEIRKQHGKLELSPQLIREAVRADQAGWRHRTARDDFRGGIDERAGSQGFSEMRELSARRRAFKIRGASNLILSLSERRALPSAWSHFLPAINAQATAIAAETCRDIGATIVDAAEDAPAIEGWNLREPLGAAQS